MMAVNFFHKADPKTLVFSKPVKSGTTYKMYPEDDTFKGLIQTDYVTLNSPLWEKGEMLPKSAIGIGSGLRDWLRSVEAEIVKRTKADKASIFHDAEAITDAFVDTGFRPSVDAAGSTMTARIAGDVALFDANKEAVDVREVALGTRGLALLSLECVEFGKKTFGIRWVLKAFRRSPDTPYCFLDAEEVDDNTSDSSDAEEPVESESKEKNLEQ